MSRVGRLFLNERRNREDGLVDIIRRYVEKYPEDVIHSISVHKNALYPKTIQVGGVTYEIVTDDYLLQNDIWIVFSNPKLMR